MSNPSTTLDKQAQTGKQLPVEVEIEFGDDHNRQAMFPPLQERMRGRWDPHKLPLGMVLSEKLRSVPVIPGVRVRVNTRKMTGELIDPLSLPENAALAAEVRTQTKAMTGQAHGPRDGAKRDLDEIEMKSWLYWCWRHVRCGQAFLTPTSDKLLTEDELNLAMPSVRIRKDYFDVMAFQEQPATAGAA